MNLNIHPILVHFPVALLTIYALSELLYFKKLRNLPYIFYCKAILVIIGGTSSLATLQTGEWAASAYTGDSVRTLIQTHSNWAGATSIIFCTLAGAYLIQWLNRSPTVTGWIKKIIF